MQKTIRLWWSGSWLVQNLEKLVARLLVIWHGCWLAGFFNKPWDDASLTYSTSRWHRCWQSWGESWQQALAAVREPLAASYLLGVWPNWLASDLTWARGIRGDGAFFSLAAKDDSVQAPPRWRLLLWVLAACLLAAAIILLPQGLTLAKWAAIGLVLVLVWARPQVSIYAVALLLPVLPILSTTILIVAAFVARICQGQPLEPRSSLLRTLAGLFAGVGLAAALASADMLAALRYWRYYLAGFLFLVLMMDLLRSREDAARLVTWGLLGAACVALFSFWQYVGGAPTSLSWVDIRVSAVMTRVTGTFDNPNMFAGYLVLWLPFAVARFLDQDSRLPVRMVNFLLAGVLGLALVLTSSRGGWVAFAASLFVIVAYQAPRLFWGVPLVLLAAPFLLPATIWQRLASIVNLEDTSNMVRLYVWDSSAKMFFANWWLGIGQGLASFARVYPVFQYGIVPALHAHSLILQLAVEGGIFLVALFLLLCLALWRSVMSGWQADPAWLVPIGAALLGHLVHGVFDHAWYDLRLMLGFWLLVGLASAAARQQGEGHLE